MEPTASSSLVPNRHLYVPLFCPIPTQCNHLPSRCLPKSSQCLEKTLSFIGCHLWTVHRVSLNNPSSICLVLLLHLSPLSLSTKHLASKAKATWICTICRPPPHAHLMEPFCCASLTSTLLKPLPWLAFLDVLVFFFPLQALQRGPDAVQYLHAKHLQEALSFFLTLYTSPAEVFYFSDENTFWCFLLWVPLWSQMKSPQST